MIKRRASATIYTIFFIVVLLALCAFAIDGSITFTNRAKLQDATKSAVLAGASIFNQYTPTSSTSDAEIISATENAFRLIMHNGTNNDISPNAITITVSVDSANKQVLAHTTFLSPPFFLSFLGVEGINLEANACAMSEDLNVTSSYSHVNWLTSSAYYTSDIISPTSTMNDTALVSPLGDNGFSLASYNSSQNSGIFSLIDNNDGEPLTLGPGGFVTIKLPAPIVNKPGYDIYIREAGDAIEGYMVFAGIDANPDNPYVSANQTGGGINWVNISCSGVAEDTNFSEAHATAPTELTPNIQDKFFGNGYFDIGNACIGNISIAKYIRIVDDNSESAYVRNNGSYHKAMLYGEASTATAGADIDNIIVYNHVRLIKPANFGVPNQ